MDGHVTAAQNKTGQKSPGMFVKANVCTCGFSISQFPFDWRHDVFGLSPLEYSPSCSFSYLDFSHPSKMFARPN